MVGSVNENLTVVAQCRIVHALHLIYNIACLPLRLLLKKGRGCVQVEAC